MLRVKGFWRSFFGVWMSVDFCGFVLSHTQNGGVERWTKRKTPARKYLACSVGMISFITFFDALKISSSQFYKVLREPPTNLSS